MIVICIKSPLKFCEALATLPKILHETNALHAQPSHPVNETLWLVAIFIADEHRLFAVFCGFTTDPFPFLVLQRPDKTRHFRDQTLVACKSLHRVFQFCFHRFGESSPIPFVGTGGLQFNFQLCPCSFLCLLFLFGFLLIIIALTTFDLGKEMSCLSAMLTPLSHSFFTKPSRQRM